MKPFSRTLDEINKEEKLSEVKVIQEQINQIIRESEITDIKLGSKTTVVSATLPNGFVLVESSSCVDPENYDHEVGKEICMKRIEDQIWYLEGYRLQSSIKQ